MSGSSELASQLLGDMLRELLDRSSTTPPDQLPMLSEDIAERAGVDRLRVWLVDYQQRILMAYPMGETPMSIDASIGGRAFVRREVVEVANADHVTVWLPLIDGVDRIGVLEAVVRSINDAVRDVLRHFASGVTSEVITRGQYTDAYKQVRRRRDMTLSAELQWELLPPTTFSTTSVTISGMLEPAYDVGGDSFDYSYDNGLLHFMIIDAVGHDLGSSFYASLAVGAYRHGRRNGMDLESNSRSIDEHIRERFEGTTFVTAQLAELDVATGTLRLINAAHPNPLLVRHGRVIGEIEGPRRVPLGVGHLVTYKESSVAEHHLEPGDMLLFYSDGVIEARTTQGDDFGIERLKSFLERSVASQLPATEVTRRLAHAVLDHHGGSLRDDATTVLVQWHPDRGETRVGT